jgi:hypothetical protein
MASDHPARRAGGISAQILAASFCYPILDLSYQAHGDLDSAI